jgi:hypothetical protein
MEGLNLRSSGFLQKDACGPPSVHPIDVTNFGFLEIKWRVPTRLKVPAMSPDSGVRTPNGLLNGG